MFDKTSRITYQLHVLLPYPCLCSLYYHNSFGSIKWVVFNLPWCSHSRWQLRPFWVHGIEACCTRRLTAIDWWGHAASTCNRINSWGKLHAIGHDTVGVWGTGAACTNCSSARVGVQLQYLLPGSSRSTLGRLGPHIVHGLSRWLSSADGVLLLIIIEHVGQDIFGVLQSLCHFGVVAIQSLIQRHRRSFSLLVHVGHVPVFRVQQDFSVVLEINLNDLIAQSEHNSVLSAHPFFYINWAGWVLQLVGLVHLIPLDELFLFLGIVILLQVGLEMLQQCHFFLQLLWISRKVILLHDILLFVSGHGFSFVVVELRATGLRNNLGRVIEEHTRRHVWKQVAQAVFRWVINPLGHPYLSGLVNWSGLSRSLRSLHNRIGVNFELRLSHVLPRRRSFLGHSLDILGWGRSDGSNGRHSGLGLLGLHLPLIGDLRHLVALSVLALTTVNSLSVSVHCWIALSYWSLAAI